MKQALKDRYKELEAKEQTKAPETTKETTPTSGVSSPGFIKSRLWVGRYKNFQVQQTHIEASDEFRANAVLVKWCNQDRKRGRPLGVRPFIEVDESILEEGISNEDKRDSG